MKTYFSLILMLLSCTTFYTHAATPKWFVAPELANAPDLNKGLSNPAWSHALKIPFTRLNDETGDTQKFPTESYWLYAEDSLYMGFKCIHPESPNLWACGKQPVDNGSLFSKENMEIFIGDMAGDLYYQFVIDTTGNLYDGRRADWRWNGDFRFDVKKRKGYWSIVIQIPKELLSTIWSSGSFITIDVARNAYNSDGSGKETTAISPPGFHSPEDRMFLGAINPSRLAVLQNNAVEDFRKSLGELDIPVNVKSKLDEINMFAKDCGKSGNITLDQYKQVYGRYIENFRWLTRLRCQVLLGFIFERE